MSEIVFKLDGHKVTKQVDGEKVDFQCLASEEAAERFTESEAKLYRYRVPRCSVVIDRK